MQETLYKTADAGDTLSDSGYGSISIRQRMQKSLYQTAVAEVSLIKQRIQKSLYHLADAKDTLSDSGCI